MEEAGTAVKQAQSVTDYQAVGVRCREALLELIGVAQNAAMWTDEQCPWLDLQTPGNTRDVVDRDIAFGPFDPAEIGAVDAALVRQRFLAQATLRPKAAHIPRQNVP